MSGEDAEMIKRRGFIGKLAGLLGLSALPVQAGIEFDARRVRREKMALTGLGPDDVKISVELREDSRGNVFADLLIVCHGSTWGQSLHVKTAIEEEISFTGMIVTPTSVRMVPERPRGWRKT